MAENDEKQVRKPAHRGLDIFESGHELGSVEDREDRERRIASLSGGEKELALETARFADLCQYLSRRNMDVPPNILDQLSGVSKLAPQDRTGRMKALNQALMEYLNDVGEDSGIRQ